jgi:hypothetical protein
MSTKDIKRNFLRFTGNIILSFGVTVLCKTLTVVKVNGRSIESLEKEKKNFILAFWHGTMLYPWFEHRNKKLLGLVSKSKDGELLAKLLKRFKYKLVRGSSSSDGDESLKSMVDYLNSNGSVAITPDGPRGPSHKIKAGAVIAAKRSQSPLILLGVAYEKKFILKSWDKFEIPKPFTKVKLVYSEPVWVKNDLSYDETDSLIKDSEDKLNKLQIEAGIF